MTSSQQDAMGILYEYDQSLTTQPAKGSLTRMNGVKRVETGRWESARHVTFKSIEPKEQSLRQPVILLVHSEYMPSHFIKEKNSCTKYYL